MKFKSAIFLALLVSANPALAEDDWQYTDKNTGLVFKDIDISEVKPQARGVAKTLYTIWKSEINFLKKEAPGRAASFHYTILAKNNKEYLISWEESMNSAGLGSEVGSWAVQRIDKDTSPIGKPTMIRDCTMQNSGLVIEETGIRICTQEGEFYPYPGN